MERVLIVGEGSRVEDEKEDGRDGTVGDAQLQWTMESSSLLQCFLPH